MKVARSWVNLAEPETYVLDLVRPGIAPQSIVGLLSNSKVRVVQSIEHDAFVDVSLTTGTERRKHVTGIASCSVVSPGDQNFASLLWSCSADGIIGAWDLARSSAGPALVSGKKNDSYSCIGVGLNGTLIAAGTEEGIDSRILFWDVRNLAAPLTVFAESHSDSITNLRFCPDGSARMLSGSLDGLVCAFDLSKPNENSALLSVLNANSSCSKIGFFGVNHEGIYATTSTETLSIFEMESSVTISSYEYDLQKGTGCRETLQELARMEVNYLVDCMWEPKTQKLILLAGNADGAGYGFDINLNGFTNLGALAGGHTAVIRCSEITELGTRRGLGIVTGAEDGRIILWAIAD
jgi:WD40 repeat protein